MKRSVLRASEKESAMLEGTFTHQAHARTVLAARLLRLLGWALLAAALMAVAVGLTLTVLN
jgi:hypothetical protein